MAGPRRSSKAIPPSAASAALREMCVGPRLHAVSTWQIPGKIDLRSDVVRRLFAQELVSRIVVLGSATLDELLALPLLLFKVPPMRDELEQIADVARRLGWLEAPEQPGGEWKLTDAGRAVRRPPSLAAYQVVTRILSVANPVRTHAQDWLPLLAIVAGGLATTATDATTANVVRALSVIVLGGAVAWQFYGEAQIVRAVGAWKRIQDDQRYAPATALYRPARLTVTLLFDLALIALFAFAIFTLEAEWIVTAGVVAAAAGCLHLLRWTLPAARMVDSFKQQAPAQRDVPIGAHGSSPRGAGLKPR